MRELGLRPSIYIQAGALFGITHPVINATPFPVYEDPITHVKTVLPLTTQALDSSGNKLYTVAGTDAAHPQALTTCSVGYSATLGGTCAGSSINDPYLTSTAPFKEFFGGDSPRPRLSVGAGFNWNSPFGPLRIDVAYALLKDPSDDTKLVTFNVGTQF